jgi:hypothetical protein
LISCCRSSVLFVCSSSRPLCLASVRVFFVCLSCVRCRVLYLVLSFVVSLCPRSYLFYLVCVSSARARSFLFLLCFSSVVRSFVRLFFLSFVPCFRLSFCLCLSFRFVSLLFVGSFPLRSCPFPFRGVSFLTLSMFCSFCLSACLSEVLSFCLSACPSLYVVIYVCFSFVLLSCCLLCSDRFSSCVCSSAICYFWRSCFLYIFRSFVVFRCFLSCVGLVFSLLFRSCVLSAVRGVVVSVFVLFVSCRFVLPFASVLLSFLIISFLFVFFVRSCWFFRSSFHSVVRSVVLLF